MLNYPDLDSIGDIMSESEKPAVSLSDIDWKAVRYAIMSVQGQNPEAQQTITDFMDMNDPIEGSNLPSRRDVQLEVYLDISGKFLFPDNPNDPFTILKNSIATTFKAKGGMKAKQFVEMVRNTHDLSQLASTPNEVKQGFLSGLFNRGKTE